MKKVLLLIILLVGGYSSINAQEWYTNMEQAKQVALKENKPIILVFQGSDWCTPCILLDRNVWSTDAFKEYAKSNYIMVKADFPRKKKNALPEAQQDHNNKLAEKYNQNGYFPLVVILNSKGEKKGQTGFEKISAKEYIKLLNSFLK
ncbi:thioredoxin family protein [Neptunitalea lumnitzerae]|nr:thioredoxin family protein [Neptunitalea sp. Y10]